MDLIFYDFETTGRDPHWDQILQVGATKVSKEFNEMNYLNLRKIEASFFETPFSSCQTTPIMPNY